MLLEGAQGCNVGDVSSVGDGHLRVLKCYREKGGLEAGHAAADG